MILLSGTFQEACPVTSMTDSPNDKRGSPPNLSLRCQKTERMRRKEIEEGEGNYNMPPCVLFVRHSLSEQFISFYHSGPVREYREMEKHLLLLRLCENLLLLGPLCLLILYQNRFSSNHGRDTNTRLTCRDKALGFRSLKPTTCCIPQSLNIKSQVF